MLTEWSRLTGEADERFGHWQMERGEGLPSREAGNLQSLSTFSQVEWKPDGNAAAVLLDRTPIRAEMMRMREYDIGFKLGASRQSAGTKAGQPVIRGG